MTRNQKIALGCGGAGCLGLIVIVVASVLAYMFYLRRPTNPDRNYNFNVNANRASNNNSTSSDDDTSSSSMSDDDKHKLFQAATMTQDTEVIQRVWKKLGLMRADGSMTNEYGQFTRDHFSWGVKNLEFIQSINTPEKARAYVDAHIDD